MLAMRIRVVVRTAMPRVELAPQTVPKKRYKDEALRLSAELLGLTNRNTRRAHLAMARRYLGRNVAADRDPAKQRALHQLTGAVKTLRFASVVTAEEMMLLATLPLRDIQQDPLKVFTRKYGMEQILALALQLSPINPFVLAGTGIAPPRQLLLETLAGSAYRLDNMHATEAYTWAADLRFSLVYIYLRFFWEQVLVKNKTEASEFASFAGRTAMCADAVLGIDPIVMEVPAPPVKIDGLKRGDKIARPVAVLASVAQSCRRARAPMVPVFRTELLVGRRYFRYEVEPYTRSAIVDFCYALCYFVDLFMAPVSVPNSAGMVVRGVVPVAGQDAPALHETRVCPLFVTVAPYLARDVFSEPPEEEDVLQTPAANVAVVQAIRQAQGLLAHAQQLAVDFAVPRLEDMQREGRELEVRLKNAQRRLRAEMLREMREARGEGGTGAVGQQQQQWLQSMLEVAHRNRLWAPRQPLPNENTVALRVLRMLGLPLRPHLWNPLQHTNVQELIRRGAAAMGAIRRGDLRALARQLHLVLVLLIPILQGGEEIQLRARRLARANPGGLARAIAEGGKVTPGGAFDWYLQWRERH